MGEERDIGREKGKRDKYRKGKVDVKEERKGERMRERSMEEREK